MSLPIHQRIADGDFRDLIYTVGDGSPHGRISLDGVNKLSGANAFVAASLLSYNPEAVLFIAGGNSGERGRRGDGVPGSLREAERMRLFIGREFSPSVQERVFTDCDPEFERRYGLPPSGNTPENGRNAAAVFADGRMTEADIVAEVNHIGRVIGTFRKALMDIDVLGRVRRMSGLPVVAPFEETTDQVHIQTRHNFASLQWHRNPLRMVPWETKAKLHHLVTGKVPRAEFAWEWAKAAARRVLGRGQRIRDAEGVYVPVIPYKDLCAEPMEPSFWDGKGA